MPSPVGRSHGYAQVPVIIWLSYYSESSPGTQVLDNASLLLGRRSEVQPDAILRILPEAGGQSRNEGAYMGGSPELVVEVSSTTRYVDLGPKLADYEQAGVLEYIVRALNPDEVIWFRRENDRFVERSPDADGLFRSQAFPGLWLDPQALLKADTRRLREVIDLGKATPEHAAFIARLEQAMGSP